MMKAIFWDRVKKSDDVRNMREGFVPALED